LRGERFISADSCCDAGRHTRAALPVNGRVYLAQRFAVDWEQLDAQGRVYAGAQSEPASYTIYGRDVVAVADAPVVAVIDGLPDQPPGKMPSNIAIVGPFPCCRCPLYSGQPAMTALGYAGLEPFQRDQTSAKGQIKLGMKMSWLQRAAHLNEGNGLNE
jgi:hypothetical protein